MPHLIPRSKGQKPTLPGLTLDARQVVVGDSCALTLPSWSALVGTIGLISAEYAIGKGSLQARIFALKASADEYLLLLKPEGAARATGQISHVFDRLAALCGRVVDAEHPLMIGSGEVFVRYRDRAAPTGYDLSGEPESDPDRALLLVPRIGEAIPVAKASLRKVPFFEGFLAHLRPVATDRPAEGPRYVLCAPELVRPLARMLRRRAVDAALAEVTVNAGEESAQERALFRLSPRAGRAAGLWMRWAENLAGLPGAVVLDEIFLAGGEGGSGRGVLSAAGMRPTVWMPNVAAELPESSLLILTGGATRNLDVRPFPRFVALERLTVAELPIQAVAAARAAEGEPRWPRTPLRLAPREGGGVAPAAAALLSEEETGWLGHWIGRVPMRSLEAVRGARTPLGLLLVAEQGSIDPVPFGRSLRRHRAGNLLVPLAMGFTPEVPDDVLREKLGLSTGTMSVQLPEARFDVPLTALRPLVDLIVEAAPLPAVEVRVTAGARSAMQVAFVEEPQAPVTAAARSDPPAGWWRRLLGLFFEWKRRPPPDATR